MLHRKSMIFYDLNLITTSTTPESNWTQRKFLGFPHVVILYWSRDRGEGLIYKLYIIIKYTIHHISTNPPGSDSSRLT